MIPPRAVPSRLLLPWDFSRQEYWSGLLFPSPGHLPDPGSNPCLLHGQVDSLPLRPGTSLLSILAFNPSLVFSIRCYDGRNIRLIFFFNCSITALQCCVSFCCTTKWISCKCTYIPSLSGLPPTPSPPAWSSQSTQGSWAPSAPQHLPTSCFTRGNACLSITTPLTDSLDSPLISDQG